MNRNGKLWICCGCIILINYHPGSLYAVSTDGTINRELISGIDSGVLLPDQKRIAFFRDDSFYLFDLRDSTLSPANIRPPTEHCGMPRWSSDGAKLVFACGEIIAQSLQDETNIALTPWSNTFYSPAWSPDRKWIAYFHLPGFPRSFPDEGLYLTDTSCLTHTSTCQAKTRGPYELGSCDGCLAWSPDSRYIAIGSLPGALAILDVQTDKVRKLKLFGDYSVSSLAWSPDGKWIAFTLSESNIVPYFNVFLISPEGGTPVSLVNTQSNKYIDFWLRIP